MASYLLIDDERGWLRPLTLLPGLLALGCSSAGSGASGELGVGSFDYVCVGSSDPVCAESNQIDEFAFDDLDTDVGGLRRVPPRVAVGSRFGLTFAGEIDGGRIYVETRAAASADQFSTEVFSIGEPAQASFVASAPDGKVADLIYLRAEEAADLVLWHDQEQVESLVVSEGESIVLALTPVSSRGQLLAGAAPNDWQIEDDSVASIVAFGEEARGGKDEVRNRIEVTLQAEATGSTSFTVNALSLTRSFEVEVTP